ncbi:MAG TPA: Gfo/Idh/MocA family oxidoreductase [Sedimentisphaerales bacterium]|nr:Gfo/Idh/MocA family oxidoreductase [Sedimentisphaerales bacterium]
MTDKMSLISRRDFLKKTTLAASVLAVPSIVPSSVFGINTPSERINIACIGVGNMGTSNCNGFLNLDQTQVLAVCDVETGSNQPDRKYFGREPVRDMVNAFYSKKSSSGTYKGCDAYEDFRDVLARNDIDAVVISTPDHWHVPISVAAAKAGKDIYCEKPLTLAIGQGRILADVVKRYKTVFQTGSHQRSIGSFRYACELVRNNRIGELKKIYVQIPGNNCFCEPTWQPMPVPESLNYDMWLGPAPAAPYHKKRCHYEFRFILDYSGGQMTNWGAHHFDIAQWGSGHDHTGPIEIQGQGEFPKSGLFTTCTNVKNITYRYANGVEINAKMGGSDIKFEGTLGWIRVSREFINASSPEILTDKIGPDEIHLYQSNDHRKNFIECIKTREDPICNAETGHRSATICHLGNIAMLLDRPLKWDPAKERFTNDDQANRMINRTMRSPWTL